MSLQVWRLRAKVAVVERGELVVVVRPSFVVEAKRIFGRFLAFVRWRVGCWVRGCC